MAKMFKVYVNHSRKQNGEWSKVRVIMAQFRFEIDAIRFADNLKRANPTWLISVS